MNPYYLGGAALLWLLFQKKQAGAPGASRTSKPQPVPRGEPPSVAPSNGGSRSPKISVGPGKEDPLSMSLDDLTDEQLAAHQDAQRDAEAAREMIMRETVVPESARPPVAAALALDVYDGEDGMFPPYIASLQVEIGAEETGVMDEATGTRMNNILDFYSALKEKGVPTPEGGPEGGFSDDEEAPSVAPSSPAAPSPTSMPSSSLASAYAGRKLKYLQDLTNAERKVHGTARNLAMAAQDNARIDGWTDEGRAAVYLKTYLDNGGMAIDNVLVAQRQMHVPSTGELDAGTLEMMEHLLHIENQASYHPTQTR